MLELAGWVAPIATAVAAVMTAANLGARVTGWGFVVFTLGAAAWMVVALATGQRNLLFSNGFLLLVDLVGVWRWLGRRARYDAGGSNAAARSAATPGATLFPLTGLEGRVVRDRGGETMAVVVEAMAACDNGAIRYLVVREGGLAGVGERLHALGWGEVRMVDDAFESGLGRDALAARPALDPARWPLSAEAAGVR